MAGIPRNIRTRENKKIETLNCLSCTPNDEEQQSNIISKQFKQDQKSNRHKKIVLLLGTSFSGKTTIFKQINNCGNFSAEKRSIFVLFVPQIHKQCITQMKLLLQILEQYRNGAIDDINKNNITYNDRKHNDDIDGFYTLSNPGIQAQEYLENLRDPLGELNDEVVSALKCLWKEQAIRKIFKTTRISKIARSSAYFFDKLDELNAPNYIPNGLDVMLVQHQTTDVTEHTISLIDDWGAKLQTAISVIDVGGAKSQRKNWGLLSHGKVDFVVFVASLSCFDEFLTEDYSVNAMVEQLELFGSICNDVHLQETTIILLLNKKDLFAEKIQRVTLSQCPLFDDYSGYPHSYDQTTEYILNAFNSVYNSSANTRNLITHFISAITNEYNINNISRDINEGVIGWSVYKAGFTDLYYKDQPDYKDTTTEKINDYMQIYVNSELDQIIQTMDILLNACYVWKHIYNYMNNYGDGIWKQWINNDQQRKWFVKQKMFMKCVSFDPYFPINVKNEAIADILGSYYDESKTLIATGDISVLTSPINWYNILEIVQGQFGTDLRQSLSKIIAHEEDKKQDIYEFENDIQNKLRSFQMLESFPDDQYEFLLNVIHKFRTIRECIDYMWRPLVLKTVSYTFDLYSTFTSRKSELWSCESRKMIEIYSTHKIFIESNHKTKNYSIPQFVQDLINNGHHHYVTLTIPYPFIDMSPFYLINDNLEELVDYIFGASYLVHDIRQQKKQNCSIKNLLLTIIPKSVQQAMNKDSKYKYQYLDKIFKSELKTRLVKEMKVEEFQTNEPKAQMFYRIFKQIYHQNQETMQQTMMIMIDRRDHGNNEDTLYLFNIDDDRILDHLFYDYLLTLSFHIHCQRDVVISYLWWSLHRVRFFSDMVSTLIPKLFNKQSTNGTAYQRVSLIHSPNFKNGLGVSLRDKEYDCLYKRFTNYTHLSCINENRKWITKHQNKRSDVKVEFFEEENKEESCHGDLKSCSSIKYLITLLKTNLESSKLIVKQHLSRLSFAYDHLIRCHGLFESKIKQKTIGEYVRSMINSDNQRYQCKHHKHCPMMKSHVNTKREESRNHGGMDSLFCFLRNSTLHIDDLTLYNLARWCDDEEFDSEAIEGDVDNNNKQSNLFSQLSLVQNDRKHDALTVYDFIRSHMKQPAEDDNNDYNYSTFNDIMAKRTFNSVHTYLLHSVNELYRIKKQLNQTNMRFSTPVKQEKHADDVCSIDFGQNVLCWLSYNEQPTFANFKEEIINNPLSTINERKYGQYLQQCNILCNKSVVDDIGISVEELMSLKIYTDATIYQSALRRAFWLSASKDEKRNFYQWAIKLYITFQRYSKPMLPFKGETPAYCYHGLEKTFAIESGLPYYNGIFSTTLSESTAQTFSNATGLLWKIKTSYNNPFRSMIGITTGWFTAFKNESEFVVFNSYIPILDTINYAQTDDQKINILIKQLTIYKKRIIKPIHFYEKIGFGIQKEWTQKIANHRNICKPTIMLNECVLYRLINELKWKYVSNADSLLIKIWLKTHSIITVANGMFWVPPVLYENDKSFVKQLQNCEYSIQRSKKDIFKYEETIKVQTQSYSLFVKNKNLFKRNEWLLLAEYDKKTKTKFISDSVNINRTLKVLEWDQNCDGCIQIYCKNIAKIDESGCIDADGCGYYYPYKAAELSRNIQRKVLYFGSASRIEATGGGIVEIVAKTVINKGMITANGNEGGSGGSIKIRCNSFINFGVIQAIGMSNGYGDIWIECSEYRNEGTISPSPHRTNVKYETNNKRNTNFTEIDRHFDNVNYHQKEIIRSLKN
eukprot:289036_1